MMPWHIGLLFSPSVFVIWVHAESCPHRRREVSRLSSSKTLRDFHEAMLEELSFLALGKSIIWVFDDAWHDWLYLPLLIDEKRKYMRTWGAMGI